MEAAGIGKYITHAQTSLEESIKILDMGVDEVIDENTALICADTQLMIAEMQLQDARRELARRMGV